jgi:formylglycine-generating enzyme required for sulfatase activity
MNTIRARKIFNIIATVILISMFVSIAWNWDIVIRFAHSYQNGTLTLAKIRKDIAAFNIGRESSVRPVDTKTSAVDGMTQVYVPEGEFLMGIGDKHESSNSPQRLVYLDSYWMDRVEAVSIHI